MRRALLLLVGLAAAGAIVFAGEPAVRAHLPSELVNRADGLWARIAGYLDSYRGHREQRPAFVFAPVTRGPVQRTVLATGTLRPVTAVAVGSQISGQIVKLEADFNDRVKRGQVVARLDPDLYQAKLDQARADLSVAEASVKMKEAALDGAKAQVRIAESAAATMKRMLARTEQLAGPGYATSKQLDADRLASSQAEAAVETSRAALRMTEAELAVARAQVLQRRAALSMSATDLDRTVIRSPVDGIVINRQVDLGQTVAAALQTPVLFEIAQDLERMYLEASVDEADIGRIREGAAALFRVDAFPGREFRGRVAQIRKAAKVVQNVTSYAVLIEVDNHDSALFPGMTANVRVIEAAKPDVLRIPAAALHFRPKTPGPQATGSALAGTAPRSDAPATVHVIGSAGSVEQVRIATGIAGDGGVEVLSGLEVGQEVIIGQNDAPGRSMAGLLGF